METDGVKTHQLGRFDRSGGGQADERSGRTLATNGAEKDKPTKERVIDERSNKTMTSKVS